ncbi:MAG TPA: MOSC domain-containing protein [Acetobacteraceae bacterium]
MTASVAAVASSGTHGFSKDVQPEIVLDAGLGVRGDAHQGVTVKHRSRVRQDPTQPNLRQVHLIAAELHNELAAKGFRVSPGGMGENVTTLGLDLLALPRGTLLHLGSAVVEVTGLRNPCAQLDRYLPGLMNAVLDRAADGSLVLRAGIMGVVRRGGTVRPGDALDAVLPPAPHQALQRV